MPQVHSPLLGIIEIVDRQIEVHLFGRIPIRPHRWPVAVDPGSPQPHSICLLRYEIVICERDLPVQEAGPKCTENGRVRTVQSNRSQSNTRHVTEDNFIVRLLADDFVWQRNVVEGEASQTSGPGRGCDTYELTRLGSPMPRKGKQYQLL